MPYRAAKISFDGSHYIATPKENFPQGHKRRRAVIQPTPKEVEQKEQFEAAYPPCYLKISMMPSEYSSAQSPIYLPYASKSKKSCKCSSIW